MNATLMKRLFRVLQDGSSTDVQALHCSQPIPLTDSHRGNLAHHRQRFRNIQHNFYKQPATSEKTGAANQKNCDRRPCED